MEIKMEKQLRYPHSCRYCRFASALSVRREVFCKYKAAVSSNFICDKYEFDPFKYRVRRKRTLDTDKFNPEDFKIE